MDKVNAFIWSFPRTIHQLILKLMKFRLVKKTDENNKVIGYYWTKYYPLKCDVCGSGEVRYMERDIQEVIPHLDAGGKYVYWEILGKPRYGCKDHKPEKGKVYRRS